MGNLTVKQKMIYVLKKYGYYFILGFLLAGLILIIAIASTKTNNLQDEITEPTGATITPYLPVANATIYKGYYGDSLCFNETLNQWETHKAIDFSVATGSKVFAILDGTIKDIYTNILEGTVVVVEHENGLVSSYGSLDENVLVSKGDKISRGDEIGSVGTSATCEASAGAHLHFSLMEDGEKIDPSAYLNISNK